MSVDVRGDTSVAAAGIDEPSGPPPPRRPTRGIRRFGQRWPHVSTAYRLLLLVVAVVLLWRLPWRDLSSLVDVSPELAGNKTFALGIFALVTSATAVLTLNYPGRADVSLLFLPVGLAWWHLGGAEATALAGLGALFGNVLRRVAWPASVVGAARLIISTAAGIGAATALSGGAEHSPFSTGWLVAAGVFFAAGSATDVLLDWLDEQWRGGIEPVARTDFLTNLLLVPLAVFFQVVNARLGFDRLAILLGGLVALLLVVRATVNLRTLHEALQQLHRAVDEEREKLSTLFLQSGEGIYTVDGELRIATVNPAMAELLGQPAEAIQGQTCAEVCHFEDRLGQPLCPDRCPLRQAQAEQRPVSQEVIYQLPRQAPKHLLLSYAAVGTPSEPLHLGIGIARDVSAQKEAERLRDDFVSLVTHELRSPLTVSTGYLSMLRRALQEEDREQGEDSGRALRYVDRIEGAEQHLLRLVNNLLDMVRVEQTDLPLEYAQIAVDRLLRDAIQSTLPLAEAKHLTVRLAAPDGLPQLWNSEFYLQEIMSNLLSNAVKYTPAHGQITVVASVASVALDASDAPGELGEPSPSLAAPPEPEAAAESRPPAEWLRLSVTDTGYGMSAEEQARLFTKFFRSGRAEVRRERGTGLGLALSKQMVERLGGTIEVQSALGAGSTFTVALPLVSPPDAVVGHTDANTKAMPSLG